MLKRHKERKSNYLSIDMNYERNAQGNVKMIGDMKKDRREDNEDEKCRSARQNGLKWSVSIITICKFDRVYVHLFLVYIISTFLFQIHTLSILELSVGVNWKY